MRYLVTFSFTFAMYFVGAFVGAELINSWSGATIYVLLLFIMNLIITEN